MWLNTEQFPFCSIGTLFLIEVSKNNDGQKILHILEYIYVENLKLLKCEQYFKWLQRGTM